MHICFFFEDIKHNQTNAIFKLCNDLLSTTNILVTLSPIKSSPFHHHKPHKTNKRTTSNWSEKKRAFAHGEGGEHEGGAGVRGARGPDPGFHGPRRAAREAARRRLPLHRPRRRRGRRCRHQRRRSPGGLEDAGGQPVHSRLQQDQPVPRLTDGTRASQLYMYI